MCFYEEAICSLTIVADNICITDNVRLTRLRLQELHVSAIPSLLRFLSAAPPHIQKLYLNIRGLPEEVPSAPWGAIDDLITTGDNFRELSKVGIHVQQGEKKPYWNAYSDVDMGVVESYFPKTHARGLLGTFSNYHFWR